MSDYETADMVAPDPRTAARRSFDVETRLSLLEGDMDAMDSRFTELQKHFDRRFDRADKRISTLLTVATSLLATTCGSIVLLVITLATR